MAPKTRPPIDRFAEKMRPVASGCIEWTAYKGENGYGRFYFNGRGALAHRWAYEYFVGPIPDGLVIDHLCRNHACVNPMHLEPVATAENVRRGIGPQAAVARHAAIAHCPKGHEYTDENTYVGGHGRTCRTCKREHAREYYTRNREEVIARARASRLADPDKARKAAREGTRRYRAKKKAEGF